MPAAPSALPDPGARRPAAAAPDGASASAGPSLPWLLAGVALVAAAVGWWLAYAPRPILDSGVSSVIIESDAAVWSGAFVMPVLVGAAVIAAAVGTLLARPGAGVGLAGAAVIGAGVVVGAVLLHEIIEIVAYGEFATIGAERIWGTPVVPHAITTWAAATTIVAAVLMGMGVRLRSRPGRGAAAAVMLLGYLVSAGEFALHVDGVPAAGFAVLIVLAGLWLAAPLRRAG